MSAVIIGAATLAMCVLAVAWWLEVMAEVRTTRLASVDRFAIGTSFAFFLLAAVAWLADKIAAVFP